MSPPGLRSKLTYCQKNSDFALIFLTPRIYLTMLEAKLNVYFISLAYELIKSFGLSVIQIVDITISKYECALIIMDIFEYRGVNGQLCLTSAMQICTGFNPLGRN